MSKQEKLLHKAKNNPGGLHFSEFITLMKHCGWILDRQKGSHQIWISPKRNRLPIQDKNGTAKKYQVEQFLLQLELEEQDNA